MRHLNLYPAFRVLVGSTFKAFTSSLAAVVETNNETSGFQVQTEEPFEKCQIWAATTATVHCSKDPVKSDVSDLDYRPLFQVEEAVGPLLLHLPHHGPPGHIAFVGN